MRTLLSGCIAITISALTVLAQAEKTAENTGNELSYDAMIESNKRMKCLYGYVATKSGDHAAAIAIFEDCIERWDDVYSMIWLAQMYESGTGLARSDTKAFELMQRGAQLNDTAGYGKLARYHYGKALYLGRGTQAQPEAALAPLKQAAAEGVKDACEFLQTHGHACQ